MPRPEGFRPPEASQDDIDRLFADADEYIKQKTGGDADPKKAAFDLTKSITTGIKGVFG